MFDVPSQNGVLQDPTNSVQVQRDEAVLYRLAVPVVGESLVTLAVLEIALVVLVDGEELLEDLLGEDAVGVLLGVVGQQAAEEEVTGVAADHAGDGTVVEVGVVGDTVLPAACCLVGQQVHGDDAVLGAVVDVTEEGHVHRPCVTGDVQVITRQGRVGLNPVVGALETTRVTCRCLSIIVVGRDGSSRGTYQEGQRGCPECCRSHHRGRYRQWRSQDPQKAGYPSRRYP